MSNPMNIFLFIIIIGRITGAPSPTKPKRIVGGDEYNITKIPWQVSLQNDGLFHFCGGSIIAPQWILTAAHCVTLHVIDPSILRVRAGATNRRTEGELFRVDKVILHPGYVPATNDFDVALIRLKNEIEFNDKMNFVKLAKESDSLAYIGYGLVSGWGDTQNSSESAIHLRGTYVRVIDRDLCNEAYDNHVTRNMFCAGDYKNGGRDACAGDSGGPLTFSPSKLYGIVSWGRGCGLARHPGVYADVRRSRKWIHSVTGV